MMTDAEFADLHKVDMLAAAVAQRCAEHVRAVDALTTTEDADALWRSSDPQLEIQRLNWQFPEHPAALAIWHWYSVIRDAWNRWRIEREPSATVATVAMDARNFARFAVAAHERTVRQ